MIKKSGKKILIFSLVITLLLPFNFIFAANSEILDMADTLTDKKDKLSDLQSSIEQYQKKIQEAQKKSLTLKNQIELINDQVEKTELEIQEAEMKIDRLETDILTINEDIKDTKKNIGLQKDLVAYHLRELEKQKRKSPLEIILLHPSFSKFFSEMNNLETLQNNLANSIQKLRDMQGQLETSQNDLKGKKNDTLDLKNQLEDKKVKLESQKTAKTILIGEAFNSESKFQSLLAQAQKEQRDLDTEISRLETQVREKLKQSDLFSYNGNVVMTWPVSKNKITTYFHDPDYPFRYIYEHPAIDIRAAQGTPVMAPAPGYVLQIRNQNSSKVYNYVVLVHSGGISTLYLHLSQIYVKPDTYVSRGQIIGLSGGTPGTRGAGLLTTGPHLHFEVRQNSEPVNPLNFLVDL